MNVDKTFCVPDPLIPLPFKRASFLNDFIVLWDFRFFVSRQTLLFLWKQIFEVLWLAYDQVRPSDQQQDQVRTFTLFYWLIVMVTSILTNKTASQLFLLFLFTGHFPISACFRRFQHFCYFELRRFHAECTTKKFLPCYGKFGLLMMFQVSLRFSLEV